ncbi:MAG: metal-sulfur cluster assembly factor [Candidatus Nanopelagicales bacterium]
MDGLEGRGRPGAGRAGVRWGPHGARRDGRRTSVSAETAEVDREAVFEAMRDVVDPELGINVVDLGLVYDVHVEDDSSITLDMTLTSAACPLTDVIEDQTRAALDGIAAGYRINWVWMPPWGPDKITDEGREMLRALGFNV